MGDWGKGDGRAGRGGRGDGEGRAGGRVAAGVQDQTWRQAWAGAGRAGRSR